MTVPTANQYSEPCGRLVSFVKAGRWRYGAGEVVQSPAPAVEGHSPSIAEPSFGKLPSSRKLADGRDVDLVDPSRGAASPTTGTGWRNRTRVSSVMARRSTAPPGRRHQSIVGMTATPDGHGYWLAAADGGIFTYGNAPSDGSAGNLVLHAPVVGIAAADGVVGQQGPADDGGGHELGGGRCVWPVPVDGPPKVGPDAVSRWPGPCPALRPWRSRRDDGP